MEIWFILLVPVVLSLLALLIFRHKLTWFEIVAPTVIGAILIGIMQMMMISSLTDDTEYLSGYVTKATYYEAWNEYINQTCTSTCCCDSKGSNCSTTYYDCSYVRNHSAYWEVTLNTGKKFSISSTYWKSLVMLFGNSHTKDMRRDYHTRDGDAIVTKFDGVREHLDVWDWSNTYSNRPQTNETIFHFSELDSIDRKNVVEYPVIIGHRQQSCIGCPENNIKQLRQVNALHGKKNQIHVFIILNENKSVASEELQKRHWKNGNKNELVIVADKDSRWAKSFSWSDHKLIESKANSLFMNKELTLTQKIHRLEKLIDDHWVRKEFSDFSYIKVQLPSSKIFTILITVFIISILFLWWGVKNEFDQER